MKKYYCSLKFNSPQISIFDGKVHSCCAASEDSVTLDDIKNHQLGIFNYPAIVEDRKKMLAGEKIKSCSSCWNQEEKGIESRRMLAKTKDFYSSIDNSYPEDLDIVLSNLCKMACVYCCKKYSHTWRADLVQNGNYSVDIVDERFTVTEKDKLLYKLSQSQLQNTRFYHEIIKQLQENSSKIKTLTISGGEPFISSNLLDVIGLVDTSTPIRICSGLGVSIENLQKTLNSISHYKDLSIYISAENLNNYYEFNRNGNSFENFQKNLNFLQKNKNVKLVFASTISNLTLFGFFDFCKKYSNIPIKLNFLTNPSFLAPSMLDQTSKKILLDQLQSIDNTNSIENFHNIFNAINQPVNNKDKQQLKIYLTEFSKRRKLNLNIFPSHFIKWLD